jgi:hypothetical protein
VVLRDARRQGEGGRSYRLSTRRFAVALAGLLAVAGTTVVVNASSFVQGSPPATETMSCTDSWTGSGPSGDWGSATNWTNGVPNGTNVNACITGATNVTLSDLSFSIGELTVSAGSSLTIGAGSATTAGGTVDPGATAPSLTISSGLQNDGSLKVDPTGTSDDPGLTLDGPIANSGSLTVDGTVGIGSGAPTAMSNDGTVAIAPGALINVNGSSTITNDPDGLLAFGIDGPPSAVASSGRITGGTLALAGSADPVFENGFTPPSGTEYFVDTGTSTGAFASVLRGGAADYTHTDEVGLIGGAPATATETGVTSSVAAGSLYGQPVQLTAAVTPASGSDPTGSVSFSAGGLPLGHAPVTTSPAGVTSAMVDVLDLPVGSESITATYGGDVMLAPSTSPVLTQVVNPDSTNVTITPSVANPEVGQLVTDTVTVSPSSPSSGAPAGTVSFSDGGNPIPTCQDLALPSEPPLAVECSQAYDTSATQNITATYSGDANFTASVGASAEDVAPVSTTTALVSSPSASTSGQSVTLTATVAPTLGTANPDGTVSFILNGASLGTSVLSTTNGITTASMLLTTLPIGSDSVTASYGGGAGFLASSSSGAGSVTVTKATTTLGLLSSANPSTAGQPLTLTATVFPTTGSGETGTVTFFENGTRIGTSAVSNGQATWTVFTQLASDDSITADYSGDTNFGSSSTTPADSPAL